MQWQGKDGPPTQVCQGGKTGWGRGWGGGRAEGMREAEGDGTQYSNCWLLSTLGAADMFPILLGLAPTKDLTHVQEDPLVIRGLTERYGWCGCKLWREKG